MFTFRGDSSGVVNDTAESVNTDIYERFDDVCSTTIEENSIEQLVESSTDDYSNDPNDEFVQQLFDIDIEPYVINCLNFSFCNILSMESRIFRPHYCKRSLDAEIQVQKLKQIIISLQNKCKAKSAEIHRLRQAVHRSVLQQSSYKEILAELKRKNLLDNYGKNKLEV